MSTNCSIAIQGKINNKQVKYIYCHWDGYIDGVGKTLYEHYQDRSKVEELIKLGSLSTLGEEPTADPDAWNEIYGIKKLDKEYKGCRAYFNRPDEEEDPVITTCLLETYVKDKVYSFDYNYLFTDQDEWVCYIPYEEEIKLKDYFDPEEVKNPTEREPEEIEEGKKKVKKGEAGWWVTLNAGNVPANTARFNKNMNAPEPSPNVEGGEGLAESADRIVATFDEAIEKHDKLNPVLWDEDEELKPNVKAALIKIAKFFLDSLNEDGVIIKPKDVLLIGSNANYNYTKDSDIDLHIIADSDKIECSFKELLYNAYKSMFNKDYEIKIKGIPVEMYIELDKPQGVSNGIYSLKNGWIKKPTQQEIPEIDQEALQTQLQEWEERYNKLIEDPKSEDIEQFVNSLYELRKSSIGVGGEFSIGNLVFKEMRNLGYLSNLKDLNKQLKSKELSLEGLNEAEELSSMKPYMLRDDGKLLECGDIHPYIKLYANQDYEYNLKELEKHPQYLDWFYKNTNNEELKKSIEEFKENKSEELLNKINDLSNQEFCRVRTSNYKYKYGSDNGEIYFRISSKGFNWFNLIWDVVSKFANQLKEVSVLSDNQSLGGTGFNYYKAGGKEIKHMPVDEFLTLKGNPVIE